MDWKPLIACFFGGAFFANAMPHLIAGQMGRPFQSPFAKPPGQGFSSSTVNVVWGAFNLAVAYGLLVRLGHFDIQSLPQVGVAFLGGLLMSLFSARGFGRFNGGNSPTKV